MGSFIPWSVSNLVDEARSELLGANVTWWHCLVGVNFQVLSCYENGLWFGHLHVTGEKSSIVSSCNITPFSFGLKVDGLGSLATSSNSDELFGVIREPKVVDRSSE
jgi:hypothetical protein